MSALLIVIAVAAALTFTLSARPAIAIPGGVLATVAWWVAASASVGLMHGLAGVAYTALGIATGGYTFATGWQVTRREVARLDESDDAAEIAARWQERGRVNATRQARDIIARPVRRDDQCVNCDSFITWEYGAWWHDDNDSKECWPGTDRIRFAEPADAMESLRDEIAGGAR